VTKPMAPQTGLAQSASARSTLSDRNRAGRFAEKLFRYDLFISYTRKDGLEAYAHALAAALKQLGLICFVDQNDFETGRGWRASGRSALSRSSKIVLLLSPSIRESAGIGDELAFNRSLGVRAKPITAVVFNARPAWADEEETRKFLEENGIDLAGDLWICEGAAGWPPTTPSLAVLERVNNDFTLRREQARRLKETKKALFIMAGLALAAVVAATGAVGYYNKERSARQTAELRLNDTVVFQSMQESRDRNWVAAADLLKSARHGYVQLGVGTQLADFGAWVLARNARPPIAESELPGEGFRSVCFLSDNLTVATADGSGSIYLWRPGDATGKLFARQSASVRALAMHGDELITANADRKLRRWDVARSTQIGEPVDLPGMPMVLCVYGRDYAVGMSDGIVAIGVLGDGQTAKIVQAHQTDVTGVAIVEPGRRLVSGGRDGYLRFWERGDQTWHSNGEIREAADGPLVRVVAVKGTDRVLVAAASGSISDYRFSTRAKVRPTYRPQELASRLVTAGEFGVSSSGPHIVLWDSVLGTPLRHLAGSRRDIRELAVTSSGDKVAAVDFDGRLMAWSTEGPEFQRLDRVRKETKLLLSSSGTHLLTALPSGRIEVGAFDGTATESSHSGDGHPVRAWGEALSGKWLVAATATGVSIYAREPLSQLWQFKVDGQPTSAAVSDSGERVLVVFSSGKGILRSRPGNEWQSTDAMRVVCADLDSSGRTWVIGEAHGLVRVFDESLHDAVLPRNATAAVTTVAFGAAGREVLVGDKEGAVEVWRLERGVWRQAHNFGRQGSAVLALRNFDGRYLQAIFADFETRVWEFAYGRMLLRAGDTFYPGFNTRLRLAQITPDGGASLVISEDGNAAIWGVAACGALLEQRRY
jgi:WD40 repeat protein